MPTVRKLAIVTGAAQGIGKDVTKALLQQGCHVIAVGRKKSKLHALEQDVGANSDALTIAALDINDSTAFEKCLTQWITEYGPLSYLVNAAGVLSPARLLDIDSTEIRTIIETNLTATLTTTVLVARHMADNRQGSIVTIGSNSGTTARVGLGAYPASKAGIIHAMKCLGLELAEYGVRCNIVSPGSTNTEMQQSFQSTTGSRSAVLEGNLEQFRLGIPLGRMAEPSDVSDLVLFLLSDKARHITMENIVIDGGATLGTG